MYSIQKSVIGSDIPLNRRTNVQYHTPLSILSHPYTYTHTPKNSLPPSNPARPLLSTHSHISTSLRNKSAASPSPYTCNTQVYSEEEEGGGGVGRGGAAVHWHRCEAAAAAAAHSTPGRQRRRYITCCSRSSSSSASPWRRSAGTGASSTSFSNSVHVPPRSIEREIDIYIHTSDTSVCARARVYVGECWWRQAGDAADKGWVQRGSG